MMLPRFRLNAKSLLMAGAVFLALVLAACGSPSAPTTSIHTSAPTLPSSTLKYIAAGAKWSGQENQQSPANTFQALLTVSTLQGTSFSGAVEYPDLGDTITKIGGSIATGFSDASELQYWRYVPGFDKGTVGTYIKFTETDFVQGGGGVELNDVYYAVIQPNGTMQGVWFRPNETQPNGNFTFQPQAPSA